MKHKAIVTVEGLVSPTDLGITLVHEHIFMDIRAVKRDPVGVSEGVLSQSPVKMENLGLLRRDPFICEDNLVLNNMEVAVDEVKEFAIWGGNTIVELSSRGIGRSALWLKELSQRTDVNIVMGCGYYREPTHPPEVSEKSIEDLTEEMVTDITKGGGESGIRSGIIGEIGTSCPISENEKKVLKAAAKAQQITGASIVIHGGVWEKNGIFILELLEHHGVNLNRVVISHLDFTLDDLDYHRLIAKKGAYVAYDTFGCECYYDGDKRDYFKTKYSPRDLERSRAVVQLIKDGYLEKILISHDIWMKILLTKYGGWGYAHILRNIVPMLKKFGVDQTQISTLLVENPKRVLALETETISE